MLAATLNPPDVNFQGWTTFITDLFLFLGVASSLALGWWSKLKSDANEKRIDVAHNTAQNLQNQVTTVALAAAPSVVPLIAPTPLTVANVQPSSPTPAPDASPAPGVPAVAVPKVATASPQARKPGFRPLNIPGK